MARKRKGKGTRKTKRDLVRERKGERYKKIKRVEITKKE